MNKIIPISSVLLSLWSHASLLHAAQVSFRVADTERQDIPCRIHLKDAQGVAQKSQGLPFWNDHFVCPGQVDVELRPGVYTYEVEHGPEYQSATGRIELSDDSAKREVLVTLRRTVDMSAKGWWSGELHVHRPVDEMPLHLRAEDLHVAPVITWWNDRNQWRRIELPRETKVSVENRHHYDVMGGEDEREGGALLYFGLKEPLPLPGRSGESAEHPSPLEFVQMARQHPSAWIDIEKPFWWDVPIWLANAQIDSIGLANNHMCRSKMYEGEAWGKPRDANRLPGSRGNGYWTQEIYYHLLNCGLRLPPSAGSASGVLPNPVGYNRAYVYIPSEFSVEAWWRGLRAGRSFVTNGPLLLCSANGHAPGHVFQSAGAMDIELKIDLYGNDTVPQIEILHNGRVRETIAVRDAGAQPTVKLNLNESGWFLVRAIADNAQTFRFASTAPYYVEIGENHQRISRQSAAFFSSWVAERAARVPNKLRDPAKLQQVLHYHDVARRYWQQLLEKANSD